MFAYLDQVNEFDADSGFFDIDTVLPHIHRNEFGSGNVVVYYGKARASVIYLFFFADLHVRTSCGTLQFPR